ncbi:tetratricopeptide repeat protein [Streptomyces sp. NPDC090022]|uniref:tetratricopeptide repeat protein n=1 Tax=Streptomyces sp. NPDC090022 TaxID=3365920 RepID=UPI0037FE3E16
MESGQVEQGARADRGGQVNQYFVGRDYYGPEPDGVAPRALPEGPVALVGRTAQVEELLGVLAPDSARRAVVVAGLAGVGKSALAVHVAERAAELGWFEGGVLFVALRGYDPGGAVGIGQAVDTLLGELGVRDAELPATAEGRLARYRSELAARAEAGRRVLIVADDAGEVGQVRDLVPPGEAHRLLVTSRDRLVAPDFGARVLALYGLPERAAAELVADALRRVWADDPRPDAEAGALAEIAGHCGRLPLALTVAAAVLAGDPGMRCAEFAAQLADARTRLEALSPKDRAGVPTGVRAAFDLSYARLPADQARLLRLLTANPGPDVATTTAAVLRLGRDAVRDGSSSTRTLLAALAGAGLLTEQPRGSDRWRMHDLVRLYAAGHAKREAAADGWNVAVDCLLSLYTGFLYGAQSAVDADPDGQAARFSDPGTALRWLDTERANLLAVVPFCVAVGRPKEAIFLATYLADHLIRRGLFEDTIAIGRVALAEARRIGKSRTEHAVLSRIGVALRQASRLEEACELLEQVAAFYGEEDDTENKAAALFNLAEARREAGLLTEAVVANEDALAIYRRLGARRHEGTVLASLRAILMEQGRLQEALTMHQESVALLLEQGAVLEAAQAHDSLAAGVVRAGYPAEAIPVYQLALAMYRSVPDWHRVRVVAGTLGTVLEDAGRYDEFLVVLRAAIEAHSAVGDLHSEVVSRAELGGVLSARGESAAALTELGHALSLCDGADDAALRGAVLAALGLTVEWTGDFGAAARHFLAAQALFDQAGDDERAALAREAYENAQRGAASRRRRWRRAWDWLVRRFGGR